MEDNYAQDQKSMCLSACNMHDRNFLKRNDRPVTEKEQ